MWTHDIVFLFTHLQNAHRGAQYQAGLVYCVGYAYENCNEEREIVLCYWRVQSLEMTVIFCVLKWGRRKDLECFYHQEMINISRRQIYLPWFKCYIWRIHVSNSSWHPTIMYQLKKINLKLNRSDYFLLYQKSCIYIVSMSFLEQSRNFLCKSRWCIICLSIVQSPNTVSAGRLLWCFPWGSGWSDTPWETWLVWNILAQASFEFGVLWPQLPRCYYYGHQF